MPGSLLRGWLGAQRHEQEQEELAEEKKRRKLEETLSQLNLKRLGREIDKEATEWERQQEQWELFDEALAQLSPKEEKKYRFGIPLPKIREPYKWEGTPYEERGARKEFHIPPPPRYGMGAFSPGAYERQLLEADPADLTEGQERYLKGKGFWYDPKSRTYLKKANLPSGLLEALEREEESFEIPTFTPSGAAVEVPEGLEDLDLSNFGRGVGAIPEISLPGRPTPFEIELPESLISELQGFDSFDAWYDSLPTDAREELSQEPETLRAIRDWYAVSR